MAWLLHSTLLLSQEEIGDASLRLTLSCGVVLHSNDTLLALDLHIMNISGHDANIIIPWDLKSYGQMFQVLEYRRYDMKWQYHTTLSPVTDSASQVSIWNLDTGESYCQTLMVRRDTAIDCAYQVIYDPSRCKMFEYVFAHTDSSGALTGAYTHVAEILPWHGPLRSNLLKPTIESDTSRVTNHLHDLLYRREWKKAKQCIHRGHTMPKDWPVINDQLYSQAVQSCLPTFYHHSFLVETKEGIQYITLVYQLGKIYRTRSRISSLLRCIGIRNVGWRLSDECAITLISINAEPYHAVFK